MFEIKVGQVLRGLHTMLLPNKSWAPDADGYHDGFIVTLDCYISDYSTSKTVRARRRIHVLICAPHHPFVFERGFTKSPTLIRYRTWRNIPLDQWRNVGNHDSCWIDSLESFLTQVYFEMCSAVNDKIAPKDLSQFVTFSLSDMWTMVKVKREQDVVRNAAHGSNVWQKLTEIISV